MDRSKGVAIELLGGTGSIECGRYCTNRDGDVGGTHRRGVEGISQSRALMYNSL